MWYDSIQYQIYAARGMPRWELSENMNKKWIRKLTALILIFCLFRAPGASAISTEDELDLASEAAVLMDAETGQVLYGKNMHEKLYPASITKIMTAILALQTLQPEQMLTVSQTAVDAVPRTSSHISLLAGEQLRVEEAMYAMGMASANDAANVLAEAVSGSLEAFAQKMNETALDLGAFNTHFTNANGLPDSQHYTTAYDMALITAAALKMPGFTDYFSTVSYTIAATNLSQARTLSNKDRLLPGGQYYYPGVIMAKTGWTSSALGTFAAAVTVGDTTLIAVTLKSPLLEDKYKDTEKLLDYGFSRYTRVTVSGETMVRMLPLGDYIPVEDQEASFLLPSEMLASEIVYSLAPGVDLLSDVGEETTVIISAAAQNTVLPDVTLRLIRQSPESAAAGLEEQSPEAIREKLRWPGIVLACGLFLVLLMLIRRLRQQRKRVLRRRALENRIRRMKKQMR